MNEIKELKDEIKELRNKLEKEIPWPKKLWQWTVKYFAPFLVCASGLYVALSGVVREEMQFMNDWNVTSYNMLIDKQFEKELTNPGDLKLTDLNFITFMYTKTIPDKYKTGGLPHRIDQIKRIRKEYFKDQSE